MRVAALQGGPIAAAMLFRPLFVALSSTAFPFSAEKQDINRFGESCLEFPVTANYSVVCSPRPRQQDVIEILGLKERELARHHSDQAERARGRARREICQLGGHVLRPGIDGVQPVSALATTDERAARRIYNVCEEPRMQEKLTEATQELP